MDIVENWKQREKEKNMPPNVLLMEKEKTNNPKHDIDEAIAVDDTEIINIPNPNDHQIAQEEHLRKKVVEKFKNNGVDRVATNKLQDQTKVYSIYYYILHFINIFDAFQKPQIFIL
jgi:hypothetical protein